MTRRIVFLNIFRGHLYDTDYQAIVERAKDDGTDVDVWSFPKSTNGSEGDIAHQLKLHRYESLTLAGTLELVTKAEASGYDGFVIGCFNDPGLVEAREVAKQLVVVAPCEASLHLAATLGRRFSILVGRRADIPPIRENVLRYGFGERVASFRTIDIPISEFQSDPQRTTDRLMEIAGEAVREDSADVILLGCTNYFGLYGAVQEEVGVPVLDPIISSLKFAELLVDLRRRFDWGYRRAADIAD